MTVGRENKPHIGIFGRCNAGKSSLLNFIVDSPVAIVAPDRGTTTDPVAKSYEILDFAPVVLIDTAGVDDSGPLGRERVRRTYDVIARIDLALLVFREWGLPEEELCSRLTQAGVPVILVYNRERRSVRDEAGIEHSEKFGRVSGIECLPETEKASKQEAGLRGGIVEEAKGLCEKKYGHAALHCGSSSLQGVVMNTSSVPNAVHTASITVSAVGGDAAERAALLELIRKTLPEKSYKIPSMFAGRVAAGDCVLLVCPIDSEAPAGRLILPQVQAIRELLDLHAMAIVVQPGEIERVFAEGIKPCLVVTDSQLFGEVIHRVADRAEVTSFSVLLAAAKGDYELYLRGLERIDALRDGDRVLIVENCSHQVSCEDIGRVKIPRWLREYTGVQLSFTTVAGSAPLPEDLASYALMVQCWGCMVTRSQLQNRIRQAASAGVAVTNYGMLIRKLQTSRA